MKQILLAAGWVAFLIESCFVAKFYYGLRNKQKLTTQEAQNLETENEEENEES